MVRQTLKILQHFLQDFYSVSNNFGTLYITRYNKSTVFVFYSCFKNNELFIIQWYFIQQQSFVYLTEAQWQNYIGLMVFITTLERYLLSGRSLNKTYYKSKMKAPRKTNIKVK